jgi:hypothetical protein
MGYLYAVIPKDAEKLREECTSKDLFFFDYNGKYLIFSQNRVLPKLENVEKIAYLGVYDGNELKRKFGIDPEVRIVKLPPLIPSKIVSPSLSLEGEVKEGFVYDPKSGISIATFNSSGLVTIRPLINARLMINNIYRVQDSIFFDVEILFAGEKFKRMGSMNDVINFIKSLPIYTAS